jgi:uncharacterized protein
MSKQPPGPVHAEARAAIKAAAKEGDLEGVKAAITRGALEPNFASALESPLGDAIKIGAIDIVQLLLEHGEKIDAMWHMDNAVANKDAAMVKVLIEAGDIWNNEKARLQCTGSYFARTGNTDVFKVALQSHPEPLVLLNQCDASWNTPLFTAVTKGDEDMVKFMLKEGAKCDVSCLCVAGMNQPQMVGLLLPHMNDVNSINGQSTHGQTPLQMAASNGHLDACEMLITAGADVNGVNKQGETALLSGAQHPAIVQLFLSHGADLSAKDAAGNNVLMVSLGRDCTAFSGVSQAVSAVDRSIFLERNNAKQTILHKIAEHSFPGMDMTGFLSGGVGLSLVNARDALSRTPLMMAVQSRTNALVKPLIEAGANLDAQCGCGQTALMYAAVIGNPDGCELLIAAGADTNIISRSNESVLDLAIRNDAQSSYPSLIAGGAKVHLRAPKHISPTAKMPIVMNDPPIVAAMKTGNLEFLQAHLKRNPDLSPEDIKAAKKYANRSKGKEDLASFLQSHLAKTAVDAMLDKVGMKP